MIKVNSICGGNIYLTGDSELVSEDVVLSVDIKNETLFVRKTNIEGLFTYGCRNNVEDKVWDKPAGYVWASRASVMNKAFNVAMLDVYYKKENTSTYTSVAIDLAYLEQLLVDTEYEINWTPTVDNCDARYEVVKKSV